MSYEDYLINVKDHLRCYKCKKLGIEENGIFKYRGENVPETHILPLGEGKEAKRLAVEEYNQLECVKNYSFLIAKDLHRYSHHLNSSQLMCYNFFRPLVEDDKKQQLIDILRDLKLDIDKSDKVRCVFEYVSRESEWTDEGTNFDFYLESGNTKVYFEIKYTEQGFGPCKNDGSHRNKFEGNYKSFKGGYKKKIEECPAIKEKIRNNIKFDEDFCKNYQLIRNVIRVTDLKKYSLFVYDERNERIKKQFKTFKNTFISEEYKDNVIGLTWQELVKYLDSQHRKEFEEKYLNK